MVLTELIFTCGYLVAPVLADGSFTRVSGKDCSTERSRKIVISYACDECRPHPRYRDLHYPHPPRSAAAFNVRLQAATDVHPRRTIDSRGKLARSDSTRAAEERRRRREEEKQRRRDVSGRGKSGGRAMADTNTEEASGMRDYLRNAGRKVMQALLWKHGPSGSEKRHTAERIM
jgi:hypothetical protein